MVKLPVRWIVVLFACAAVLGHSRPAIAQEDAAEVLEGKGLKKAGVFYIIEAETVALEEMNKSLPSLRVLNQANEVIKRFMVQDDYVQEVNNEWIATQGNLNEANIEIDSLSGNNDFYVRQRLKELQAIRASLVSRNNACRTEFNLAKNNQATPAQWANAKAKFRKAADGLLDGIATSKPLVDQMQQEYKELKADPVVTNALKVLREQKKVQLKLGPSDSVKKLFNLLRDGEILAMPENFDKRFRDANKPVKKDPPKRAPSNSPGRKKAGKAAPARTKSPDDE